MPAWPLACPRRYHRPALVALALMVASHAGAAERELHVVNRPDSIAPDTIQKFEAETGITVRYETAPSDETVLAALRAGNPKGWDLVVVSATRGLQEGLDGHIFRPVAIDDLRNHGNLDAGILALLSALDPGNRHAVPFVWGTSGLALNEPKLAAVAPDLATDDLALLFDPAIARRVAACGIAIEDDADNGMPALLSYLGLDPSASDAHELDLAARQLKALGSLLPRLEPEAFTEALASGRICAGFGASVDIVEARARAEERDENVHLSYAIPRQRTREWIDVLAIPASGAHEAEALAFIDFLLRPEVISDISDASGAASPNPLAGDFVDDRAQDEAMFPSPASRQRLFLERPMTAAERALRLKAWRTAP